METTFAREGPLRTRIRDGDADAFRELFDDHVRAVYNHAYRLTGDWSTAEDVVSLTFLEAWRVRDRVDVADPGASLRPWLLGISTNVARNVRRAARRHAAALARLPPAPTVPDVADEVSDRHDNRRRLAVAMAAMARLHRREREVLALCVWSGLDYAEAAEAIGIPVGTVRSRLSRARRKLAALVTDGGSPPREGESKAAGRSQPRGGIREPAPGPGQVGGDREIAVRFAQETTP